MRRVESGLVTGCQAARVRRCYTDVAGAHRDMRYEAFVSYSHAVDGRLAPALQSALHRLAKPWYRLRALRVFRDKTSLSANPGLWPSIERALAESKFFLLL